MSGKENLQPTHTDADYEATLPTSQSTITHNKVPANMGTITELFKSHKSVTHGHGQEKGVNKQPPFQIVFKSGRIRLLEQPAVTLEVCGRTPNSFWMQVPDHASIIPLFLLGFPYSDLKLLLTCHSSRKLFCKWNQVRNSVDAETRKKVSFSLALQGQHSYGNVRLISFWFVHQLNS